MNELAVITLENEMDLTLAYKKSIRVAELLGLTISTQTAFATAVSEVCREVIDKAFEGTATLGTVSEDGRFFIAAKIYSRIDEYFNRSNEGLEYARKLVPFLEINIKDDYLDILLKLGVPRSTRLDQKKVTAVKRQLSEEGPLNAYEEVKQKKEQLQQLNEQKEFALSQEKYINEQKSEFLSIASHELNSPLTVLRSYAEIAIRVEGGQNPHLNKYLNKIESQTRKMVSLVRQLMDLTKFERGEMTYTKETVEFRPFLENITESIRLLAPDHVISLVLCEDCQVNIDLIRIEQVLSNLVGNAVKYSGQGSAIEISANVMKAQVSVTVRDHGIGMSRETLAKVFEKFFRSKKVTQKYSGLGMGLYISNQIITDHGGEMHADSTEGEGSIFSFTLPFAAKS